MDLPDLLDPAHDHLVIYHLMFWPGGGCPMCSVWLDGLHGVAASLAQHLSFAVLAPAPLLQIRTWGRERGWTRLRLVRPRERRSRRASGSPQARSIRCPPSPS